VVVFDFDPEITNTLFPGTRTVLPKNNLVSITSEVLGLGVKTSQPYSLSYEGEFLQSIVSKKPPKN
jgi:hypothetical protein